MLTLEYIPYSQLETLNSEERVAKILEIVKKNRILLIEGRLKAEEETELIKQTMENISDKFKGIELGTFDPGREGSAKFFANVKKTFVNMLLGDRVGMTIIGPASVVKEIKQDPEKIQVLTQREKKKRRK